MNKSVIDSKLESLRRCLVRVEDKTPESIDGLLYDLDTQDVIVLNLSRAIQITVDIASHIISESNMASPATMKQVFDLLVGMEVISDRIAVR